MKSKGLLFCETQKTDRDRLRMWYCFYFEGFTVRISYGTHILITADTLHVWTDSINAAAVL